jgi:hypothetical protein
MATANTAEKLWQNKFFRNMNADDLAKLAGICREVEFPARSTVFEEYELAHDVYVATSGEISLAICEPNDACRQWGKVGKSGEKVWGKGGILVFRGLRAFLVDDMKTPMR